MVFVPLANKKKKMLKIKLTNCSTCIDVEKLLCEVDETLKKYASNALNNAALMLNLPVNTETIGLLIQYKRILSNKIRNSQYANTVPLSSITSRIKILINK
jgi:hypothetical protein